MVGTVIAATIGLRRHHALTPRQGVRAASPYPVIPHIPRVSGPQPQAPESLAIGPDGGLYIADDGRDQILELRHGTFRVVVGTGKVGFAGDGGPAIKAEIDQPSDVAFRNSTLYFTDYWNHRVRAVSPAGIITTVAGDGLIGWVADDTPAPAAPLNPSALTFGPNRDLYVASDQQVLRLNADGTFTRVLGNQKYDGIDGIDGPAIDGAADSANGLAFDSRGDLYVFGSATKGLLMVDPHGSLRLLNGFDFYPRGSGGLATTANGTAIAMNNNELVRLSPHGTRVLIAFPSYQHTFHGVKNFLPNGLAIGPDGTIYVDTAYGNGYVNKSAIVAISPSGTSSLLWEQRPPATQG